MYRRAGKGIGRERSDMEFLDYILATSNGKESMASAMAKAAAPKLKQQKKPEHITAVDIEIAIAENKHRADRTLLSVARLANDEMSKVEASEAALNMEGVSRTLKNRERERKNTAIWKLV
jgi:hypothetical protein